MAAARLGYAYYACASLLVWAKCILDAATSSGILKAKQKLKYQFCK